MLQLLCIGQFAVYGLRKSTRDWIDPIHPFIWILRYVTINVCNRALIGGDIDSQIPKALVLYASYDSSYF